jgi:hypothetical protein
MSLRTQAFSFVVLLATSLAVVNADDAEGVPVGAAQVDITPEYAVRLSGYSSRRKESEGVAAKIWAKALAIGDASRGGPALLVTVENCGVPGTLVEAVYARLEPSGLRREQLVVSSSHSHTAPWLEDFAPFLAGDLLPVEHGQRMKQYARELEDKLVQVASEALGKQQPARLYWAQGTVGFAANRRVLKDGRWAGFGVQPDGPVDHRLPVLVAKGPDGRPIAVWANYACHCTTLGGDFNQICGDWAGYAQQSIEADFPGAVSLISIGCGADANPEPRGKLEFCRQHGRALADEVKRLLAGQLTPVDPHVTCRLTHVDLPFDQPPPRAHWEAEATAGGPRGDRARYFLTRIDRGEELPTSLAYPVAAWTFGDDLAMVFLAGEVVVDFSIELSRRFDADRLWITAYANDVPCYIPSTRILREGGYEADHSMIYYGRPTRLAPQTEDIVLQAVRSLLPSEFVAAR